MNDIAAYLDNMKLLSTIRGLLAGSSITIVFGGIQLPK